MSNAISTQVQNLRNELEARKETIFAAAASHIRPERFLEQVARVCIKNPKLLECSRSSLFMAAAQAAVLGLEIDSTLGQAYIVPYGNEATLVPGYLGLKELAYRSDKIASIDAEAVYKDDEFDYELGTDKYVKHKPSDSAAENQTPTHVYAIVKTVWNENIVKVMSWAQVEKHRNKFSKGANRRDSAWQTNPVPMALKTVLRKALKLAPLSAEVQQLLQADEYVEAIPENGFTSGTEAPVTDLDAIAGLLENDAPHEPTAEELADLEYAK